MYIKRVLFTFSLGFIKLYDYEIVNKNKTKPLPFETFAQKAN